MRINERVLVAALERLAAMPGLLGCTVVDGDTGMPWGATGSFPELAAVCESAWDYWRLACRRREYASLGELRAIVVMHAQGRVTLVGCGEGLLLVTLSREPDAVDWPRWKGAVGRFMQVLAPH
jgi:hypothetical protein